MEFNGQTCTTSSWGEPDPLIIRRLIFIAKRLDMPRIYYLASEFIPNRDKNGNSVIYSWDRKGTKILMMHRSKAGGILRDMRKQGILPIRYKK